MKKSQTKRIVFSEKHEVSGANLLPCRDKIPGRDFLEVLKPQIPWKEGASAESSRYSENPLSKPTMISPTLEILF